MAIGVVYQTRKEQFVMAEEYKSWVLFGGCGCGAPYAFVFHDGTIRLLDPLHPEAGWYDTTPAELLVIAERLSVHGDNRLPVILAIPGKPGVGMLRVMRPLSLAGMIEKNKKRIETMVA
jgi:hypothetical protein